MRRTACPALVFSLAVLGGSAPAQTTTRVNVTSTGLPGLDGLGGVAQGQIAISDDGFAVAFVSNAPNLGNTDLIPDLFVHDSRTGVTEMVSVGASGLEANNGCAAPSISADGTVVAFESNATNLVAADTTADYDIFVRDRNAGTTELITVDGGGLNATGRDASISHDGRYVALRGGLVFVGQWISGICVYDRVTGTTTLASVHENGSPISINFVSGPVLSGDGDHVFFTTSLALVAGDTNNLGDVYRRNLVPGTTELVSLTSTGALGNGVSNSLFASSSMDGSSVAFLSAATNMVPGDGNGLSDVFVRDTTAGTTVRANVSSSGTEANGVTSYPRLASQGGFVTFESAANNLVPLDGNGTGDSFVRDLAAGTTERVSVTHTGAEAYGYFPSISGDGQKVAFGTGGGQGMVAGPTATLDLEPYVRDRGGPASTIATYCTAKINSLFCVPAMGATGVPSAAGPTDAFDVWSMRVLSNKWGLIFWGLAPSSNPFLGGTKCVANPVKRTGVAHSGGNYPPTDCTGTYAFRFTQAYLASKGLAPGTTVYCQAWQRDPGFPSPNSYGLSDGLSFVVIP